VNLSIVTVNYRSWGYLEKALAALQTGFPDDWEIIVVDNESEPDAFNEFRNKFPWVRFIANEKNSGFGFGCSIGVAQASGAQFLFMNPDVVARCADIRELQREKAAHADVAILAPRQVDLRGHAQKVFDDFPELLNQSKTVKALSRLIMPGRFVDPRAAHQDLVYCDWVTGSVLLIDRADYEAIGGWSPDYWMYVEDTDLCRKAHDAGLRVAYTPNVQVVHTHGGSSRLNVAVKSMTKVEVIISKHVYTRSHMRGIRRWVSHTLIIVLRLPVLVLAAMLDLVTLGRIPALRVRSKMLLGLLRYYREVVRTGSWLSPRAKANQAS
jgi:GT2 family glycosyltransferase